MTENRGRPRRQPEEKRTSFMIYETQMSRLDGLKKVLSNSNRKELARYEILEILIDSFEKHNMEKLDIRRAKLEQIKNLEKQICKIKEEIA